MYKCFGFFVPDSIRDELRRMDELHCDPPRQACQFTDAATHAFIRIEDSFNGIMSGDRSHFNGTHLTSRNTVPAAVACLVIDLCLKAAWGKGLIQCSCLKGRMQEQAGTATAKTDEFQSVHLRDIGNVGKQSRTNGREGHRDGLFGTDLSAASSIQVVFRPAFELHTNVYGMMMALLGTGTAGAIAYGDQVTVFFNDLCYALVRQEFNLLRDRFFCRNNPQDRGLEIFVIFSDITPHLLAFIGPATPQ